MYRDYRDYLLDMVAHLKTTRKRFSYRHFSEKAGFSSSSYLKLVADGRRNVSQKAIPKIGKGLELSPSELTAFEALVYYTSAKSEQDKHEWEQRLLATSADANREALELSRDHYGVYSTWYAGVIRELILVGLSDGDVQSLSKRLWPRVPSQKVKKALELLVRTGLVQRTADGLRATHAQIVSSGVVRAAVLGFHRRMLSLANAALDVLPNTERSITSVTVALSRSQYEDTCEQIDAFRAKILDNIEAKRLVNDELEVYHLGIQFFPVTRRT